VEGACDVAKADVRFGSLADIVQRPRQVCFTPKIGHLSVQVGCLLSARSGHPGTKKPPCSQLKVAAWAASFAKPRPGQEGGNRDEEPGPENLFPPSLENAPKDNNAS
jgi:hypothetical protein